MTQPSHATSVLEAVCDQSLHSATQMKEDDSGIKLSLRSGWALQSAGQMMSM